MAFIMLRSFSVQNIKGVHSLSNGIRKMTFSSSPINNNNVAFVGLGAMGYGMAANLQRARDPTETIHVWNRTTSVTDSHQQKFGTRGALSLDDLHSCSVVFLCLPTSNEVEAVCSKLGPILSPGTIVADCTSGDPHHTRRIAAQLEQHDVTMVDCPVSGGPAGAKSGELSSMIGGPSEAVAVVTPYLSRMAQKTVVPVGSIGSGHAVKAVNNALNTAHLVLATEGLLALAKFGVAPDVAVEAINGSSGRSLQTEVRVPKEVLTRDFDYGFPLGLMLKDVSIAVDSVCRTNNPEDEELKLFPLVKELLQKAVELESKDADYTNVVRPLEAAAGVELHANAGTKKECGMYIAPSYIPTSELESNSDDEQVAN